MVFLINFGDIYQPALPTHERTRHTAHVSMRGADFDSPMDTVQLIDGDSSSSSSAEVALRSGEDEAADPQTAFATAKTKCGNRLPLDSWRLCSSCSSRRASSRTRT